MSTPCILLIGFEPFGGEPINPSHEIVRCLSGESIDGHVIVASTLPVEFATVPGSLQELLDQHDAVIVLGIGQAGGRPALSLERIAVNLADARIADNAGAQPCDVPLVVGAPAAYFSTLPVKAMVAAMHAAGVPATLSLSAGTFVCNQCFYELSHRLEKCGSAARSGFLHVPWLPEQAVSHPGAACLSIETMLTGVRAALACAIATDRDIAMVGGEIH
ncbi:MAG: pyroglutamyl-peptidase I [Dokdonella sp.]